MHGSTRNTANLLEGLPDEARLWVFGVGRALSPEEEARFLGAVDAFLATWRAHGASLAAAREWRYGRFLLVGVDERVTPPSGCSIDALVGILRGLEEEMDLEILGGGAVWYRDERIGGAPRRTSRAEFRSLADDGEVSGNTVVFDFSLTRVGEARGGAWETVARESWHGRFLDRTASS